MLLSFVRKNIIVKPIYELEKRFLTNNSRRKQKSYYPVHLSQKPPASADIDFGALNLQYPVVKSTTFLVPRVGWAPLPTELPILPFLVDSKNCTLYSPSHILYILIFTVKMHQSSIYQIERTTVGGHFPVYSDFKGSGTKVVTILRKISGDIEVKHFIS